MASNFPVNPYFREYLYDILYRLPPEDKFKLKGKYYKIGKSNFYAKRFCETAKLEEIMYVLGMLEIEWFLVLFDDGKKPEKVTNIYEKDKDGNRNTEIRKIIERRMHVTGVKGFAQNLATVAATCNNSVYRQHLELHKAGYHARGWSKKLGSKNVTQSFFNLETLKYLSETILNSALVCRRGEVAENDALVLLFIYKSGNNFVNHQELFSRFEGIITKRRISGSVKNLLLSSKIQKHSQDRSYTTTALGVSEVNKIMNNVLKENSF